MGILIFFGGVSRDVCVSMEVDFRIMSRTCGLAELYVWTKGKFLSVGGMS